MDVDPAPRSYQSRQAAPQRIVLFRGSREQNVEKLRRLRMAGVTQFNIYLENGDEEKLIADYAERILPEVRRSK